MPRGIVSAGHSAQVQRHHKAQSMMPEAEVLEAESTLGLPTDEELATMRVLRAEQEQLLSMRSALEGIDIDLRRALEGTYQEHCNIRKHNANLHAQLVKTAAEFGVQTLPEDQFEQNATTQAVESIEDFILQMRDAGGALAF